MKAADHYGSKPTLQSHNIVNIGDETPEQVEDQEIPDEEPTSVRIDIALGNQRHRITLFADSNPDVLAADFA